MAATIYPGLHFYAEGIYTEPPTFGLCRTASTYSYGNKLELAPRRNCLYVICKDGSVQNAHDPEVPIGWEVFETETGWSYCITQHGFEPQPCLVRFHSNGEAPDGGHSIGSKVVFASAYSQDADMHTYEDKGESEVTSEFTFPGTPTPSDEGSPVCPGAPRKSKNPFFDSDV